MSPIELKRYPDPCLRVKTSFNGNFDPDLRELLDRMAEIMYVSEGIGLAATQVGVGLRVFVMDVGEGLLAFVDPEVLERSSKSSVMEEGCLSLPGISVKVSRPEKVKIRAKDASGTVFTKNYEGLAAKAVQHEIDHLDGKIITDHLNPIHKFFTLRKLNVKGLAGQNGKCEVVCRVRREDK